MVLAKSKWRILLVDDDDNICKVISAILEDKGYHVDVAFNGNEAIAKTESKSYDILLVDIRLPDMQGTELLGKVKEGKPRSRKIICTGYPTLQNAIAAVNEGADAYIMKPFDVEHMLKVIEDQIEKRKLEGIFTEQCVANFIQTKIKEQDTEK